MRILYIFIFSLLASTALLWLGRFGKIARRRAACAAAALLALGGVLLACAVLPFNSVYPAVLTQGSGAKKEIALTFDDGPYPPYTQEILQVLAAKGVRATFVVVGENAARHPEIVRAARAAGHEIALHALEHKDFLKLDARALEKNIRGGKNILEKITGERVRFLRPPHGFKDWQVLRAIRAENLAAVTWSIAPRDWTNPGAERIAQRVIKSAHPGGIVLLHDGDSPRNEASRAQTVAATALVIDALRSRGYCFVTIGELEKEKGR